MQLLAFDTSTDRMSIAVGRTVNGVDQVWSNDAEGGALASRTLVPAIQDLLAQAGMALAELDAIVFGRGPGAFTGLRTACAVAQGLAWGARARTDGSPVPVLPLDSLLVVAEQARAVHAPGAAQWQVLAMLDARMDEIYAGTYRWEQHAWQTLRAPALIRPQDVALQPADQALAGNVFANYGARLPDGATQARVEALPDARAMLRLAPILLAAGQAVDPALALPVYIRDKVASTTAERAATLAAAAINP
ncbi:MAG: tRNA (adenosine(37)-N6)-threonylcarbamoyltransferase complex dimerization subunit type 1 TsaB [Betaproteobacteria bacterium]